MKPPRGLCVVVWALCWLSASASAGSLVVAVPPPNGTDDTGVIQDALDQCVVHGPGCTVQLDAGTYLTKQLFAEDFHGVFKGKGMDVTIIQALPNLPVNEDKPVFLNPPSASNKYPMLVLFFEGDITVSDMSIRALEIFPTQPWYEYADSEPGSALWGILEFMSQSEKMNVAVTRVALKGAYDESGPLAGYNACGLSLDPYPPYVIPSPEHLTGTFRVTASRFDTFLEGIYGAEFHDARLTIGGSPSGANIIRNSAFGAILVDLDSSTVDFSYNDVSVTGPLAVGGFVTWQAWAVPIAAPSSFLVRNNRIKATGSYEDGIWIVDYGTVFGEGKTGDFVITNNEITIERAQGIPAYAGIQTDFTEGAIISNNRIVGSGQFGIVLEGDTRAMVKANNVQKVTADFAPIGLMENVWWAPDLVIPTTDSTVVGFGKKTNVYDEGINNTLVGINSQQGNPPGPAIRDAMKRKAEMIKSIR